MVKNLKYQNTEPQGNLFIHATNIHQGGGRALLESIFNVAPNCSNWIFSLDSRMPLNESADSEIQVRRSLPSVQQRYAAEKWLAKNVNFGDVVLCLGNLPPLLKLRGYVLVYVQNRYLIDDVNLKDFPLKIRLRLWVERFWLSYRVSNVDEFIVQTNSMKILLDARIKGQVPVTVLPFIADNNGYGRGWKPSLRKTGIQTSEHFDFLYVASGEPHKNHRKLIEAWCLLAEEGLFPSLKLTLDKLKFSLLCSWIDQKISHHGLNIVNAGNCSRGEIERFYSQSSALIFPSTFESFGLPLIEARQAGLPILASELDYVRDVVDPEHTFDPESIVSIARAVKRFLKVEEQQLPVQDAKSFIQHILRKAQKSGPVLSPTLY
jgi:glycosyltransferase involved in cell wall biosynthesis